jgi:hypothetical protein
VFLPDPIDFLVHAIGEDHRDTLLDQHLVAQGKVAKSRGNEIEILRVLGDVFADVLHNYKWILPR